MKKVLFSHFIARLFGTLNRNDIKIRISIFFTCGGGGKLGPCETKEWGMRRPFFSLTLSPFSSLPPSHLSVSHPFRFWTGRLGNFVAFPRPKWILFSVSGIKFKWKLDGIPGEELGCGGFESLTIGEERVRWKCIPENGVCFPKVSEYLRLTCRCGVRQAGCSPTGGRTPCPLLIYSRFLCA